MSKYISIAESPLSRFLFSNTVMAPLWLAVRLYIGSTWLVAGLGKVINPKWAGDEAGTALAGFIKGALAKTAGEHPDVAGWYADFLQNMVLPQVAAWSNFVVWGEILVGAALLVGLFTGLSAFLGLFMNINFMLAGALSVNPILFTLSILLMLAWRVAGYWGIDYWLLPKLGVPWRAKNG